MTARRTRRSEDTIFELTSVGFGGIVIDENRVDFAIEAEDTEDFPETTYVWDIKLTAEDGTVENLLEGRGLIEESITR
jgi:hypothetical protein